MEPSREAVGQCSACPFISTSIDEVVYFSRHALERLREHYPNVGVRGARAILAQAQTVEPGFIAPFLGRPLRAVRDRYLVSADRRGVFVLVPGPSGARFLWTACTYLRFGPYQQSVAAQLLGDA